ncbi:hypothetical protein ENBRE01_1843 [Enteropsectra breve]|nr:hypothetical protein ENBRE01_1843 [Enteropsectra breve]
MESIEPNKNVSKSSNDEGFDSEKYDRQIRLFGKEVQKMLSGLRVEVIGGKNYVASEILKNLVLLGVKTIAASEENILHTYKLVPDPLTEINKDLKLVNSIEKPDFIFVVDEDFSSEANFYFVCSKCILLKKNSTKHECCRKESRCREAMECLAGALAVQEFLKYLQNRDHVEEYKIDLM